MILKFFVIEARFPRHAGEVPRAAVDYVAGQVKVDPALWGGYDWSGRLIERHRAQIREELGFRGHCCIKAKGVLVAPQSGDVGFSGTWRTVTNRAFECLLRGFWTGEWITSGDPNAQCNSAPDSLFHSYSTPNMLSDFLPDGERHGRFKIA